MIVVVMVVVAGVEVLEKFYEHRTRLNAKSRDRNAYLEDYPCLRIRIN